MNLCIILFLFYIIDMKYIFFKLKGGRFIFKIFLRGKKNDLLEFLNFWRGGWGKKIYVGYFKGMG